MTGATITVLGVDVAASTRAVALRDVAVRLRERRPTRLAFVNAHTLNLAWADPSFGEVLRAFDLVLNDGVGLSIAARLRGARFPQNLNGSDFTLDLLAIAAAQGARVFLYGGRPGVADEAAARLRDKLPGLLVVGTADGYSCESPTVVAEIRRLAADVVLVALGNPLQEHWIARHLAETEATLGAGVGAFLDFQAQTVARAPAWMNRAGIEWCYRLAQEPDRLWRRYLLGNPAFLLRALRETRVRTARAPR